MRSSERDNRFQNEKKCELFGTIWCKKTVDYLRDGIRKM